VVSDDLDQNIEEEASEKEDEDSDGEPEKSESWCKTKSTNEAMVEGGDQDDTLGHGSWCWEAA